MRSIFIFHLSIFLITIIPRVFSTQYFDFVPKYFITDNKGIFEYDLFTLEEDLSKFIIKPFGDVCDTWIYDFNNQVWIKDSSSWDKFPLGETKGKIRISSEYDSCSVSLKIHSTTNGNTYETLSKKIWLNSAYGNYLYRYSNNISRSDIPLETIIPSLKLQNSYSEISILLLILSFVAFLILGTM